MQIISAILRMDDKVDLIGRSDSQRSKYGACDLNLEVNLENDNSTFNEDSVEDSEIKSNNLTTVDLNEPSGSTSNVGDNESQTLKQSGHQVSSYVGDTGSDECERIEDVACQRPWWRILLEVLVPFLCAGLGLAAAGLVLDIVQVRKYMSVSMSMCVLSV